MNDKNDVPTSRQRQRAQRLRRDQTPAEIRLWGRLRNRKLNGAKFRRQVPVAGYIVDFMCCEAMLIVEADGGQHVQAARYGAMRTQALEGLGFVVLRYWNKEILEDTDAVIGAISEMLHWQLHPARSGNAPSPALRAPSPVKGEGER